MCGFITLSATQRASTNGSATIQAIGRRFVAHTVIANATFFNLAIPIRLELREIAKSMI